MYCVSGIPKVFQKLDAVVEETAVAFPETQPHPDLPPEREGEKVRRLYARHPLPALILYFFPPHPGTDHSGFPSLSKIDGCIAITLDARIRVAA